MSTITKLKTVNIKGANGLYYKNVYIISTIEELDFYHERIYNSRIEDATKDIIRVIKEKGHYRDRLSSTAETIAEIKNMGSFHVLADLSDRSIIQRTKLIYEGKTLVINYNGGYFLLGENDIVEEINEIIYTESDINITQFEGGKHYYAKIGQIEVIDEFGDRKWNTYNYALDVAKKYLTQLNKN